MAAKREKVVVAMSGGVDSSVAACLLVERGYDVIGLFMRVGRHESAPGGDEAAADDDPSSSIRAATVRERSAAEPQGPLPNGRGSGCDATFVRKDVPRPHQGCCSAADAADARFVAGMLGIPFYALNFQEDFDRIIDYFADEYVNGRTPNPCVVCNDRLKFGKLVEYADAVGAKYIATGHYARIGRRGACNEDRSGARSDTVLMRGCDVLKDQSYVLFGLNRAILDRVMFPVGELTKDEVRDIAARSNLPNRDKPDSVDICFVPDRDYARVVRQRRPEGFTEGNVLDRAGCVVGRHKGIGRYTIGQRRGLGIAAGRPIYVTQLDVLNNTVTVGERDDLLAPVLIADRANFLVDPPERRFRAQVKIRYLHKAVPATVEILAPGMAHTMGPTFQSVKVRVVFDEPQRAITPGQAVVFYDGEVVLGGAWIERSAEKTKSPSV